MLPPIQSITQIFPNKKGSANWYITLQHRGEVYRPVQMTTNQLFHLRLFEKRIVDALGILPVLPETQADWTKYLSAALLMAERFPVPNTLEEQQALFQKLYPYSPLPRKRNKPPWD